MNKEVINKLHKLKQQHKLFRLYVGMEGTLLDNEFVATWFVRCYTPIEVSGTAATLEDAVEVFAANLAATTSVPTKLQINMESAGD